MTQGAADWPGEGKIIAFAREAAALVCRETTDDELHALLALALDREAVVSSAYISSAVAHRLTGLTKRHPHHAEVVELIRQAVRCIWLQEEAHTNILRNIEAELLDAPYAALWHEIYGRTKGILTQHAAGNQAGLDAIAQGIISVGAALGISPAFSSTVSNLSDRAFFSFSSELEAAAIIGYEQIQERVQTMYATSGDVPLNIGLITILGEILIDEVRHQRTFATIRAWFAADDTLRADLTKPSCRAQLLSIFQNTPKARPDTDQGQYRADHQQLILDEHAARFLQEIGVTNVQPTPPALRAQVAREFFLQR
jgi:hypothetical protein